MRAIIFDIYKTLLEVGPPPADAEKKWIALGSSFLPHDSAPTLSEFHTAAERLIAREHSTAKNNGISFPEIFWPWIACEAWPALARLDPPQLGEFLYAHSQLQRTIRLMPGAAGLLKHLQTRGLLLGLASNSQPYTLLEMERALASAGLSLDLFHPSLQFLSFQNGFSKPDPHVYRLLAARLASFGIHPGEALLIGDRQDNDILPARAQGFRTWWLVPDDTEPGRESGNWFQLHKVCEQLLT